MTSPAGSAADAGRKTTGALAAGAALLLLLPLVNLDPYLVDVLTAGFLLAVFCGSWDIVGGLAGQITLGHALFFGIATYACAVLTSVAGWPLAAAAPAAIVLSAIAALGVGSLAAPLSGPFAALLTLCLGELAHEIALVQTVISPGGGYAWGGEGGIPVRLPWTAEEPLLAYYAALALLILGTHLMLRIARSDEGLILSALSGSERTARASGVDVGRYKRRAYLLGGTLAGAAGAAFAAHVGRATASDLSVELSFQAATAAAIGGRGTIVGPVIVSLLIHVVFQGAGLPPAPRVIAYALALPLILRFLPAGIVGTIRARERRNATRERRGKTS